jgi:hypothetical protein
VQEEERGLQGRQVCGQEKMTIEDFQEKIWHELPFVRRNLVGRDRVDDLIWVAIENCPVEFMGHVDPHSNEQAVVSKAWEQSTKRGYCLLYGNPIIWILLSPILQSLIKRLWDWWFSSPQNRILIAGWKRRAFRD